MTKIIKLYLPLKTQSPNLKEHWSATYRRNRTQTRAVTLALKPLIRTVSLPVTVSLCRVGHRTLDEGDNLPMSMKAIRDCVSSLLRPGLAPGRADDGDGIKFTYTQRKSIGNEDNSGIEISIEETIAENLKDSVS